MLQAQTVPGAVWRSCLRTQLRVACAFQVWPLVLVVMQCKAAKTLTLEAAVRTFIGTTISVTLPLSCSARCHIITQFNQGFYDYIIATDEQSLADPTAAAQTSAAKGKKKKATETAAK